MIKVKIVKSIFLSLITLGMLVGCSSYEKNVDVDDYEVKNTIAEVSEGDYIFRLISEKEQYTNDEEVNLYGEIVYTGEMDEVEIVHSSSAILFNIFEEVRKYEIGDGVHDIGLTTTLKRNEPYREEYGKSAGYDSDSDKAYVKFVEDFINQDGFPSGYYTVNGFTDFAVFEGGADENATRYNMETTVDFKVSK